jgi:hypothetical protein
MVWSVALTLIGLITQWLIAKRRSSRKGWTLGMVDQILWVVFALCTGQYGFIASAFAYGMVFYRGYRNCHFLDEEELETFVLKVEMAAKLADCMLARSWRTYQMSRQQKIAYYLKKKKAELEALMEIVGVS